VNAKEIMMNTRTLLGNPIDFGYSDLVEEDKYAAHP
jgi:hypothetical protein